MSHDGDALGEEDEESGLLPRAPALGEPVLPTSGCGYAADELQDRINRGIPPESAEEYLARVALEAERIPAVVAAQAVQVQAESTSNSGRRRARDAWNVPEAVPVLDTLDQARRGAIRSNFVAMRDELAAWASDLEAEPAKRRKMARVAFPTSQERNQWMEFIAQTAPLMHVLLQMDNTRVVRGLRHVTKQIEVDSLVDDARASWLFAMLARLDVPYTDDVATTLKRLIRLLAAAAAPDSDAGPRQHQNQEEIDRRHLIRYVLQDFFALADGS